MFLQSSPEWKHLPMPQSGCVALSVLWYVSKRGKLPGSISQLEEDILHMIFAGMHTDEVSPISPDCYVNSYDGIAKWYGIKVIKPARFEDPSYICKDGEEETLDWFFHGRRHTTAGNGKGIVTYDPIGYWRGFPEGKLSRKCILTWQRPASKS